MFGQEEAASVKWADFTAPWAGEGMEHQGHGCRGVGIRLAHLSPGCCLLLLLSAVSPGFRPSQEVWQCPNWAIS